MAGIDIHLPDAIAERIKGIMLITGHTLRTYLQWCFSVYESLVEAEERGCKIWVEEPDGEMRRVMTRPDPVRSEPGSSAA